MGGHNEQDYSQRGGLLDGIIIPLSRRLRKIAYLKAIRADSMTRPTVNPPSLPWGTKSKSIWKSPIS